MTDITTERLVLSALVKNQDYMRKVFPFLKPEYFLDRTEAKLFELVHDYINKFSDQPNRASLTVSAAQDESMGEKETEQVKEVINDIFDIVPPTNEEWLINTTEQWCKDKAIYLALNRSIQIQTGEGKKGETPHLIPTILSDALAVCFDSKIGMDLHDDVEARWDYYTNPVHKIPFDLSIFNEVTDGGIPRKTLNLFVAGVNVGKSMGLIHLACMYMRQGLNVLYISNEMKVEEVFKRVDANLLKTDMKDIPHLGRETFTARIQRLREKSQGRLKVKEYSAGASSVAHYRHLLNELSLKQNFVPDVILVDYLGITASANVRAGSVNSYEYYKHVATELRALASDTNTIVWTAAQFNRSGMASTDAGMEDLAESKAIADTADGMWGFTRTEELDALGQILVKQLKSRYNDKSQRTRFTIGVDVFKQWFFDVEQSDPADLNPEKHKGKSNEDLRKKFASRRERDEDDRPINRFGTGGGGAFGDFNFG